MKNIGKIISAMLCVSVLTGILSGCKKYDNNEYVARTRSEAEAGIPAGEKQPEENKTSDGAWKSMNFSLDGKNMNIIKMPYSTLQAEGWSFNPETYGLQNLSAEFGDVYQRNVYVDKEGYDEDVFLIGLTNFNAEPCGLDEIQLWSIEIEAKNKTAYPEVVLEGGITWGSDEAAITAAYGEPSASVRNEETKSTELKYADDIGNTIYLEVYDDGGVGKIIMESYF